MSGDKELQKQIVLSDRRIEGLRFKIAAGKSIAEKAMPFIAAWNESHKRKRLVEQITEQDALQNRHLFAHLYQHVGFGAQPQFHFKSFQNRWVASTKRSFDGWSCDNETGSFFALIEPLKARYRLAKDVGQRRIDFFNKYAQEIDERPIETLSDSYIERQTPGLRMSDIRPLVMNVKDDCLALDARYAQMDLSVDQEFFASITAQDKMHLAHKIVEQDTRIAGKIALAETQSPLAQGTYDNVSIGLSPDYDFFAFLLAILHEVLGHAVERANLNPEYKYDLRGVMQGAAGDERGALHPEYFADILPWYAAIVHRLLKETMGSRFSQKIRQEHIVKGLTHARLAGVGGEPGLARYALDRYVYAASESEMIDSLLNQNPVPIEDYPGVFAKHYEEIFDQQLSRQESEKLLVRRFQSFVDYGRAHAYIAGFFAAAMQEREINNAGAGQNFDSRWEWLRDQILTPAGSQQFMDVCQNQGGLSEQAFRQLCPNPETLDL